MVIFSSFVQAAEGSTCGIVPYVNPPCTGSIAGIVGAGGNTGAVCFGLGFHELDQKAAFNLMGGAILASGFMTLFISVKGHAGLFFGSDRPEAILAYKKSGSGALASTTLQVPLPDVEYAEEDEK